MRLHGSVAVVTGGGSGIGRGICLRFAEEGAHIVVADIDEQGAAQTAAMVQELGQEALIVAGDVSSHSAVESLFTNALSEFGHYDILVNNAGIAESHKLADHPDHLWEQTLALNLSAVYHVTKAFYPSMTQRQWGRIIMIASIAGKVGLKYASAYAASKHGLLGFTRSIALEAAAHNITVNAVCPGYVDTPMTKRTIGNIVSRTDMTETEARSLLARNNPQNRLVDPSEVAAMVVMLATDSAHGINGQAINVDGGTVMH